MYNPFEKLDLNKENPIILGIESSCDETAAAVIKGRKILSNEIASSASVQALFGGVDLSTQVGHRAADGGHLDESGARGFRDDMRNAGLSRARRAEQNHGRKRIGLDDIGDRGRETDRQIVLTITIPKERSIVV